MNTEQKNKILADLAELIKKNVSTIVAANECDIAACNEIDSSLLDRLKINEIKIASLVDSLHQAIVIDDPEGKLLYSYTHANGMRVENRAVPFGTILIIYESRPDVTIEAAITAFKAGNKILLKGGKEARNTNLALVDLWHQALQTNGANTNYVSYFDGSREQVQELIKGKSVKLDLIVPRGGDELIRFVTQNAKVPVMVSGRGNNFMFIDCDVDFDIAVRLVVNGKKRISVCNALDKVLLHNNTAPAKIKILIDELTNAGIEVLADTDICSVDKRVHPMTGESIWSEEFLAAKILLSKVDGIAHAIDIINRYSGGHSACIATNNTALATQFQMEVDCAAVYHNASTRFTDGNQFGLSAEMAISTQKLHFRGPVGIAQLVTNKWFVYGDGQTRE